MSDGHGGAQPPLPLFRIRRLCKTYGTGERAVRPLGDVDLEFIVLPGASGSAKSTLLTLLGGLDIASVPMSVDEAVGMVGLAARRDHFPARQSSGEQQRVAIVRRARCSTAARPAAPA
ncbi:hypothetical protein [Massilia scottii]|uniref:hypothetical protein n=1 Tax=Massilia scottii TaxID=3057166 RepID=UPI0035B57D84